MATDPAVGDAWRDLASSAGPVVGTDERGRVTFWNEAAARLHAIPADEALGRPLAELLGEHARRDSESRFRALFEGATIGIGLATLEPMRLVAVNRALADFVGHSPEDLLRLQLPAVSHPDDWRDEHERLQALAEHPTPGSGYRMEKRYLRPDGATVWGDLTVTLIDDPLAASPLVLGIVEDITERKRVERELRESEERYRKLVEMSPESICVHRDGVFLYANPAAAALVGVDSPEELIGRHAADLVAPQFAPRVNAELERVAGGDIEIERRVDTWLRRDGVLLHIEATSRPIVFGGQPARQLIVRDISTRIGAEEAMRRSREELRQLTRRLQEVREQEQARLAREIHDELGQALTGIALDVGWLRRHSRRTAEGVPHDVLDAKLDELARAVEATLESVKRLSLELHPLVVDLGLVPAVQWQVDSFCRRTGVVCDLDLEEVGDLPPPAATVLFRILQEALTNVARHAAATRVKVTLRRVGEELRLVVTDDGRGFDPLDRRQGLGLVAMSERAQACSGTLEVRSAPGAGTEIHATIQPGHLDKELPR